MNWLVIGLVSFFGAVLSALGMGGGGILLIYLTIFQDVEQLSAQGLNLTFFVPIAIVALILHIKNKLVVWKAILPCVALGLVGVWFGAKLAMMIGSDLLSRLFGGFLLLVGLRELFSRPKEEKKAASGKKQ